MELISFTADFKNSLLGNIFAKHPELVSIKITKLLIRNEGFTEVQRWFLSRTTSSQDEKVFASILQEVFNISEVRSWDIFDAFNISPHDTFKEFYILCLLASSLETNDSITVLYLFGKQMFIMMTGSESSEILLEKAKIYGRFLGFHESLMRKHAKNLGLIGRSRIGIQLFQLFYFSLLSELGQDISARPTPRVTPRDKRTLQKSKCKAKCQGGWCSLF